MKTEKHGWASGKTFACAVGLKAGPRKLHLFGDGTTHSEEDGWLVVTEPNADLPNGNVVRIPMDNVAFVASPMFLIDEPPKGST